MFTLKTIGLLALVSSALAAPAIQKRDDGVAIVTAFTTVWVPGPAPTTTTVTAVPVPEAAAPSAAASAGPVDAPEAAAPSATPEAAPAAAPSTNDGSYMSIVNEWRAKMGMSSLQQDGTLEGNALKTLQDSPGQMVHELNPGSFAQVLAPGDGGDFEHCFVGGWLCEKPDLPGLDGVCATESSGWSYDGTGHADILTSSNYGKIGCANYDGIWGCDLS